MRGAKILLFAAAAVIAAVIGWLVFATFSPDLARISGPLPLPDFSSRPQVPAGEQTVVDELINFESGDKTYVLAMDPAADGGERAYLRGTVQAWSQGGVSVNSVGKTVSLAVEDSVGVLCQPETIVDESGNPISSKDVYLDLNKFTGNLPRVEPAKLGQLFPAGSDLAVVAVKRNDSWLADMLVGFGCSL